MRICYSDSYPQKATETDQCSSILRNFAPFEEHVAKVLGAGDLYIKCPLFFRSNSHSATLLLATLTTIMKTSTPQTMPQSRTITQLFTETDAPSFWLGFAAASALKLLEALVHAPPPLPNASTTIALLGAAAMPCGIYAIITAIMEGDAIQEEEKEEKRRRLQDDVVEKSDGESRDESSLLSIRSKMRLAAYFRVARRTCFGIALVIGGFGTFCCNMDKKRP